MLLPLAYEYLYLSRRCEQRLAELFRKGYVKGTVTLGIGNEATAVGMSLPMRPGLDFVSLLHRDFGAHLVAGMPLDQVFCQYMANANSPTHGHEGNVHFGDAALRRLPMISHLGRMLSVVVGGVWGARRRGEDALGLAVIGDGGSSTGEFHEALNLASVREVPVLFLIENNQYAFSTPASLQFRCERLSDRAAGYGIDGGRVDGTDVADVYEKVFDALEHIHQTGRPYLLEADTVRLTGHAVYDPADYIAPPTLEAWKTRDPVPNGRRALIERAGWREDQVLRLEQRLEHRIDEQLRKAAGCARIDPGGSPIAVYAPAQTARAEPYEHPDQIKNGKAVNLALTHLLERHREAVLLGQDIGPYGSAFKTCKGLHARFGPERVMDMPLAESGMVGFALGAAQADARPIVEFQFADFSTEATTQVGLNCGSWFFRTARAAPMLLRLPCGGGVTMGAFHSAELEGLWTQFPGLKLLYPYTPQETYEALLAGYYDPNPCLVFENKLLYWNQAGTLAFDGDLDRIWRPRRYRSGQTLTVVAIGAALEPALAAAEPYEGHIDVWNPFVLKPLMIKPIIESVRTTGRVLVIQMCPASAGLGPRLIAELSSTCHDRLHAPPMLLATPDTPVPFAPEREQTYRLSHERVLEAIESLLGEAVCVQISTE